VEIEEERRGDGRRLESKTLYFLQRL